MSHTTDSDGSSGQPKKAGLFDIRNIIGALMALYGVILAIAGLLGEHEPEKTGGVNANLWTGLALLAVGLGFFAWAKVRPIVVPPDVEPPDDDPVRPAPQRKRPPAH